MKFRLKKLTVKNFKVFKDFEIKFNSENLILLDGPNGFGKTSFFDALELLFLGKVQRYIDIEKMNSYGQKKTKPYPLMFDRARETDIVLIQLLLELDSGDFITLKRSASCSSLMELKMLKEAVFQLEVFKGDEKIVFDDETKILTHILGKNYQYNYSLFHYIEQEENTALLKNKDTDKQAKMDHLFDVTAYRDKINRVAEVRKAIRPLRAESKRLKLDVLQKEITTLEKEVNYGEGLPIPYTRLINSSMQPWDQETVSFEAGSYAHWLGENGELEKISGLKKAEFDFVNNKYNEGIKRELALTDKVIEPLLRFGRYIEEIPKFKNEIKLFESSQYYLSLLEGGVYKLIKDGASFPSENIVSRLGEKVDFILMKKSVDDIQGKNNTSNVLTQSLNNLVTKREIYILEYNKYQAIHQNNETMCPTCGFDWENFELLVQQFDSQKQAFIALLDGQGAILQDSLNSFKIKFIDEIKSECELVIVEQKASIEYKKSICSLLDKQLLFLKKLKLKYIEYKIDLTELYATTLTIDEDLKISQLKDKVGSYYKPVNYDILRPEYDDLFKAIFDESVDELNKLEISNIELKINYIKQKFSESRLQEIGIKKERYDVEKKRFDEANKLEINLKRLFDLYNDNVNEYISSISQGIEILFHIYSGRLLQNFHNGLGIFIESDGKSVSFRDTPKSKHDVIFIMSSGQLSSLVIAFTLALNQKYAKNDLLLIDDPVQTMDEINVAGFIDLLRRQFKKRQIFISTHEDHTSSYFRYKFSKAGLEHERINFNEINKQLS